MPPVTGGAATGDGGTPRPRAGPEDMAALLRERGPLSAEWLAYLAGGEGEDPVRLAGARMEVARLDGLGAFIKDASGKLTGLENREEYAEPAGAFTAAPAPAPEPAPAPAPQQVPETPGAAADPPPPQGPEMA